MAADAQESILIAADPVAVYDLVADVERMGEWSPEATGARRAPLRLSAGDRFIGSNRRGPVRWYTQCTVLQADRGAVLEFDVDFGPVGISRWRYDFVPQPEGGTRVTESWQDRRDGLLGPPIRALGSLLIPGDRAAHNRRTMRVTLHRLRAAAEAAPGPAK